MSWFGATSHCAVNGTELVEDKMQSVTLFIKALVLVSLRDRQWAASSRWPLVRGVEFV